MNKMLTLFLMLTLTVLAGCSEDLQTGDSARMQSKTDESARLKELDDYWAEVSRCVNEGDFDGYKATCHEDGVYVSGKSDEAYPLSQALERWGQDFVDAKSGVIKASVDFRFSKRLGDETTALETGVFCYSRVNDDGTKKRYYVHLEALLIKRGSWKILMEYQMAEGTETEWDKLK